MTTLHILQSFLQREGLKAVLHEGTAEVPLSQLVVTISELQKVDAHLLVLPPILGVPILQMAIELPVQVYPEHLQDTCQLLCVINSRIPLKGFEISDVSSNRVLFRLMIPMLAEGLQGQHVLGTLSLVTGLIRQCSPYIIALAIGKQDYSAACSGVLDALYQ